ncbi:unnamed protein product [Thlaspi arvense]|uniref:Reverse transcriptase domain-containing protein n=1 Tax=Thlaspi arvense TaxID=13288 RepID=A0AAU9S9A5_THLAR|nr:unnamed protein product [Thlaspi arvense]
MKAYQDTISEAWTANQITGSAQFKLARAMKFLKHMLRRLNKRNFSGISARVKEQALKLTELQRSLLTSPRITHLLFADDLLVFSDGLRHSLSGIKEIMAYFRDISGLDMNPSKTEIFFSGYDETQVAVLSGISGFKIDTFPTRYLGLPLNPNRITMSSLQPFVEKITSKLHSWTVKSLSFAGKIRLMSLVIYGMVNFWKLVFTLPKMLQGMVAGICLLLDLTKQVVLSTFTLPLASRGPDCYLMRNRVGMFVEDFSSEATWNFLREHSAMVPWSSVIWFREAIPRCSFIPWLRSRRGAVARLLFQVIINSLWKERNGRIFSANRSAAAVICSAVDRIMRDRLLSLPGTTENSPSSCVVFSLFGCWCVISVS